MLLRDPGRRPAPDVREEVDAVRVDQYDVDAVVAATKDVDALFRVDPTPGGEDPLADYARATESVVRAVTANRIGRVASKAASAPRSGTAPARSTAWHTPKPPWTTPASTSPTCAAATSSPTSNCNPTPCAPASSR